MEFLIFFIGYVNFLLKFVCYCFVLMGGHFLLSKEISAHFILMLTLI